MENERTVITRGRGREEDGKRKKERKEVAGTNKLRRVSLVLFGLGLRRKGTDRIEGRRRRRRRRRTVEVAGEKQYSLSWRCW